MTRDTTVISDPSLALRECHCFYVPMKWTLCLQVGRRLICSPVSIGNCCTRLIFFHSSKQQCTQRISHSPMYISTVVVAKAKMKEARILLVQEMMPTNVSSSFIKSLKMLMENNVPGKRRSYALFFYSLHIHIHYFALIYQKENLYGIHAIFPLSEYLPSAVKPCWDFSPARETVHKRVRSYFKTQVYFYFKSFSAFTI